MVVEGYYMRFKLDKGIFRRVFNQLKIQFY